MNHDILAIKYRILKGVEKKTEIIMNFTRNSSNKRFYLRNIPN